MIVAATLAGFVQGVTGFGSGIVLMIFLPHLLPIGQSAGVSTLTMLVANIMIVWHYRKFLKWKKLAIPFAIYMTMAICSLFLSRLLSAGYLKSILGLFLIVLSLYYTIMNLHSVTIKTIPIYMMIIFSVVSGFFNGMFGIGGPLMALYFLTISDSKENYLASIQTFFLIDTFIMTSLRFASGILTMENLKFVAIGIIGAIIGTVIANKLVGYLNTRIMTLFIYGFIGISGLYYLLTSLLI